MPKGQGIGKPLSRGLSLRPLQPWPLPPALATCQWAASCFSTSLAFSRTFHEMLQEVWFTSGVLIYSFPLLLWWPLTPVLFETVFETLRMLFKILPFLFLLYCVVWLSLIHSITGIFLSFRFVCVFVCMFILNPSLPADTWLVDISADLDFSDQFLKKSLKTYLFLLYVYYVCLNVCLCTTCMHCTVYFMVFLYIVGSSFFCI